MRNQQTQPTPGYHESANKTGTQSYILVNQLPFFLADGWTILLKTKYARKFWSFRRDPGRINNFLKTPIQKFTLIVFPQRSTPSVVSQKKKMTRQTPHKNLSTP